MEDKTARGIIEEEIRLKTLGPGYAKDIFCYNDTRNEIVPGNPKRLYSLGVLIPQTDDANNDQGEDNHQENDINTDDDVNNSHNDGNDGDSNNHEGAIETPEPETSPNSMMDSHIGLVMCINNDVQEATISVNYGTYRKLSWEESIEKVKVSTDRYYASISDAIVRFEQYETLSNLLQELGLPKFSECIEVNNDAQCITISCKMTQRLEQIRLPPQTEYKVEAELINLLLGEHYQRTHHSEEISLDLNANNGSIKLSDDDNVHLLWNLFEARGKKFLKILLRVTRNVIYQPEISVTIPNGRIESYVEPITSLEDDEENSINEFVYRKVCNYGKGINCALDWDTEGQRVFTTFTPTIDIEKFSNDTANNAIKPVCELRNLSIWSEPNNDEYILGLLQTFVDNYDTWHSEQMIFAQEEPAYKRESARILERQQELLDRLNDNISYLRQNKEALTCFKIANTAMLLQMVVARHPLFSKNRDANNYANEPDVYNNIEFFKEHQYINENFEEPRYYPFQLAFLLMNVKSTFEVDDKYRREVVDLIWFPTGGGKTEAYLALTALTIIHRRRRGAINGVSVIMRYTLRMLTSQQFERASYLICALEFLRRKLPDLRLGDGNNKISIGIYVGGGVTPNRINELAQARYNYFFNNGNGNVDLRRNNNPFPITYCPWCGSRMVSPNNDFHGYGKKGELLCINTICRYNAGLPIYYIDEQIYQHKPTLLFATVDKFAVLAHNRNAHLLRSEGIESPDLIIQDELHLIVGALGSIVGFYESIINILTTNDNRTPKIIASTATTRNTQALIKNLFNREASIFPAQGLEYSDNYFSQIVENAKRRHIGIMPSANTNSNTVEIRLTVFLLLARIKLFKKYIEEKGGDWLNIEDVERCIRDDDGNMSSVLDNYWTSVFYFNSLKDLGRSKGRVSQEVYENFRGHKNLYSIPASMAMLKSRFNQRVLEFTSRIQASKIKSYLTDASSRVRINYDNGRLNVASGKDLIFATNMISVGIDIERWNLMVMVGQPRSTSEYVQSSSRVARTTYGLVINLLNPRRTREHSLFENYKPFHSAYYKSVEPLSITPLTSSTIKHKVLNNIARIYRNIIINDPAIPAEELADIIIDEVFGPRFELDDQLIQQVRYTIENADIDNNLHMSLRDIVDDSYINIKQVSYKR